MRADYNRYIAELSGGEKAADQEIERRIAEVSRQLAGEDQVPSTNKLRGEKAAK